MVLKYKGGQREHNILLYVENLGAKVTGYIEYKDLNNKNPEAENKKVDIKEFYLDLMKGQSLVKNHTFKEFWQSVEDFERELLENNGQINVDLQDQVER